MTVTLMWVAVSLVVTVLWALFLTALRPPLWVGGLVGVVLGLAGFVVGQLLEDWLARDPAPGATDQEPRP